MTHLTAEKLVDHVLNKVKVFTGVVIQGQDLSHADLSGVTFKKSAILDTNLDGADLKDVSLAGCRLANVSARGADLRRLNLDEAVVQGLSAAGAKADGMRLNGAVCEGLQLDGRPAGIEATGAWLPNRGELGVDVKNPPAVKPTIPAANLGPRHAAAAATVPGAVTGVAARF